jgi:hypothetical protein
MNEGQSLPGLLKGMVQRIVMAKYEDNNRGLFKRTPACPRRVEIAAGK